MMMSCRLQLLPSVICFSLPPLRLCPLSLSLLSLVLTSSATTAVAFADPPEGPDYEETANHTWIPYDSENPAVTHWWDEQEMRQRMLNYSREKFSHEYHYWRRKEEERTGKLQKIPPSSQFKRSRRDGGILSGPVTTAIVTGMIGMTARAVQDLVNYQVQISQGGCSWFGTAPLCNYPCPAEYDYIRESNGRCSAWWFAGICVPDDSFGKPCSTLLGGYFYKRFCCKSDPAECAWSGRWMGANTAHNIYCRYDHDVGRCGSLDCSINHFTLKAQNASEITGERCDKLELFGLRGKATCGYIAWFDQSGELVNSWYKTSASGAAKAASDSG